MKFAGCAFLFFLFTFLGVYASSQLDKRIRQLKSLEKAVFFMKREIDYRLSPLGVTLLHTGEKMDYPWNLFFSEAGKHFQERREGLCCPDEIFRKELEKIRFFHPWEKDLEVLIRLGKSLGELDKKMQIMQLSMAEEEIRGLLEEAVEEKKTKGKLYRTLGMSMGILSVILVL